MKLFEYDPIHSFRVNKNYLSDQLALKGYTEMVIVLLFLQLLITGHCLNESTEDLISTTIFENYNQFERPPPLNFTGSGNKATEVIVYIQILSITSVNIKSMQFTLDMYLRQKWTDRRLAWEHRDPFKHYTKFITSIENKKKSWIPDLFFRNGKVGRIHNMTCENMLFRIWPNGNILFSQKITMTFSCAMDFSTFPMDTQVCFLNIGSYGYTTDELVFKWMPKTNETSPIKYEKQLQIPEFATPTEIPVIDCTNSSGQTTGTYSCLKAYITLERQIGWWLANTFVPNILVVMVSWLNFWVSLEAVPARVTLGFLTLLVTITQSVSKGSPLPRVSYIKAIDVWTMACIVFNVSVLVEYAVASNMARKSRDLTWKKEVRDTVREEITKWCNACLTQYNLRGRPASLAYHNQTSIGSVTSAAKAASSIEHGKLTFSNEVKQFLASQDISFDEEIQPMKTTQQAPPPPSSSVNLATVESGVKTTTSPKVSNEAISIIDKRSRIGFPLMFTLFNCCYWSYYLAYMKDYNKIDFS